MRKVTVAPPEYEFGSTGQRIEYYRTQKGLSQQDLADVMKVKRQMLSYIEKDERNLTIDNLKKISMTLQVSADYLLGLSNISSGDASNTEIEKRLGLSDKAIKNLEILEKRFKTDITGLGERKILNTILSSRLICSLLLTAIRDYVRSAIECKKIVDEFPAVKNIADYIEYELEGNIEEDEVFKRSFDYDKHQEGKRYAHFKIQNAVTALTSLFHDKMLEQNFLEIDENKLDSIKIIENVDDLLKNFKNIAVETKNLM